MQNIILGHYWIYPKKSFSPLIPKLFIPLNAYKCKKKSLKKRLEKKS